MASTTIYKAPLDSLTAEDAIDITPTATPCRYRLLNCIQFTQHKILHIDEFPEFPPVAYSAISYVWRGNFVQDQRKSFVVTGAEDADPISIDVLRHACTTSVQRGAGHLWLDRLCIMQISPDDKAWQISRMNNIYRSCAQCIVLPGGLGRLVQLHEETAWIHRAWTLQEVLAPNTAVILFSWKLGPGKFVTGNTGGPAVHEVIRSQSAVSQVADIVDACVVGEMLFTRASDGNPLAISGGSSIAVPARIFGVASPNLKALGATMSKALSTDPDAKNHAIWQCALMRTSSRPVDMVFSIMGLFGVTLDPRKFQKNDRLGATIALAQKILDGGGSASWLGASIRLPPCRQLSSFSQFPQTSVAGKALVQMEGCLREVAKMMDGEYPNSLGLGIPMPGGRMDDAGYLTFSTKAACIIPATREHDPKRVGGSRSDSSGQVSMTAVNGTVWEIYEQPEGTDNQPHPHAFGVLFGWFQRYHPGTTLAKDVKIRLMLIEEHAPGKFHLKSFFSLDPGHKNLIMAWEKRTFSVGGPDALNLGSDTEHVKPDESEAKQGNDGRKDGAKEAEVKGGDAPFYDSVRFTQYFNMTKRRYDIPRHEAAGPLFS